MNNIKVGIIGVGNMGSSHLKNITNGNVTGMTVIAVCDINPEKTNSAKEKYPELEIFQDYRELLKKADIDAVIIATPHPLHAKIATAALENGKHTLLEKPEDIAVSVAEKLNSVAEKSEKIFAIDFNQRTNGLFQEAHRIVKSGELGELKRSVWIITNCTEPSIIMHRAVGVQPGAVRVAEFFSIKRRITSTFGNGYAVCRNR